MAAGSGPVSVGSVWSILSICSRIRRLGQLRDNGGPTGTLALGAGSQAIDRIPAARCPKMDQRGKHRPDHHERKCDIGAYEHQDP
jgi:hypothetical protein